MGMDHIALTAGLVALALIFGTVHGKYPLRRKLGGEGKRKLEAIANRLDAIHLLPALWVIASLGIGGWLITRIALSYM